MNNQAWLKVFTHLRLQEHNFKVKPFFFTSRQIKEIARSFKQPVKNRLRILPQPDKRENRPEIFSRNNLFLLPVKHGKYVLLQGEGYIDLPYAYSTIDVHRSDLNFALDTIEVGNSEMQHVDYAYASSLIRSFLQDDSLVLTIRGRKYTPRFTFKFGGHEILVESVQTEVDAGYEGEDKVVLIEAKNRKDTNVIIRQLYYPYRQWRSWTEKEVIPVFFSKVGDEYHISQFEFAEPESYESIRLVKSGRYKILSGPGLRYQE